MIKFPISHVVMVLAYLGIAALPATGQTAIEVLNPGFEDGANPDATDWNRVDGEGANSSPSNYAEQIPGLTSRTMQIKSDGGNYVQQPLLRTAGGDPVDAASYPSWTVGFQQGYRRDAVRNGPHTLRVSLWNIDDDAELAGADFTIDDPGTTGTNSLSAKSLVLSYDNTDPVLAGRAVALRITSTSPDLGGNSWSRTAVVDDIAVFGGAADPVLAAAGEVPRTNLGADETFSITFQNDGQNVDLTVSDVTLDGFDATYFEVLSFPPVVAPGATGSIDLRFMPDGPGAPYQVTLVLETNDPLNPSFEIRVVVTVEDPSIALSAERIDFGVFASPPAAADETITLTNLGANEGLFIVDAAFLGSEGGAFSVAFPGTDIAPGGTGDLVVTFAPAGAVGDFGGILRLETNAANRPVIDIPVLARVEGGAAATPLAVVNGDFNAAPWLGIESPAGWSSGGSSYGQTAPDTPNLASIAAHLMANNAFYAQNLTVTNPGLAASVPERLTIAFMAGYRNDALSAGPILLRAAVRDATNDIELAGRDLILEDLGVLPAGEANQLMPMLVSLDYDRAGLADEEIEIRISHVLPVLGGTPWAATAIIDDVEVAIDGDFTPPSGPYAAWAAAAGLTPGVNDARTIDADGSGLPNGAEFFLNGNPLDASDNGMLAQTIDAGALVISFAAPAGTDFGGGASATVDGVTGTVEGSLDLATFEVPVSQVTPPVVPADWPAPAPLGWQYHSFRLDAPGAATRGFLRLRFD